MSNTGVIQLPQIEEVKDLQSLSPNNKTQVYVFSGDQGKRDSIIVVAQLSPEFTARLVDRWQELESGLSAILMNDPIIAIRMGQIEMQQAIAETKSVACEAYMTSQMALGLGVTLQDTMTIDYSQQCKLNRAMQSKVASWVGANAHMGEKDIKAFRNKTFPRAWRAFQDRFEVASYKDTPSIKFNEAHEFIQDMTPFSLL